MNRRDALLIGLLFTLPNTAWSQEVPDAVLKAEQQRIAAIAKAGQAAVSVFSGSGQGGGSGVVITPDGYALSNFHVTKPVGNFMKCSMPDGELYDAVIVGIDPTGDVAMIKLLGRDDFPFAEMADSDAVRVGDWCFAVGNPFLLATDFQPTVSYGIVSGVHRYQDPAGTLLEYADCIQTDAAINPGNSGGPLFNADGQLIGINGRGSFEKRGRVNVGVGYAISINQIQNFMGYLRSGRIVDHATLGATVSTDVEGRVVVTNILESSDAYRRGLRYGDEIVSFGGRSIFTVNGFKNALGIFPKGWRVPLSFRRDGRRYDVLVRLAGVHSADELLEKIQGPQAEEENPDEPKEDGEPDDAPRQPMPIPRPVQPKTAVPDEVAKFFEARKGYANYYFNELNQNRVWEAFVANGQFSSYAGVWTLSGVLDDKGPVEIEIDDQSIVARFPTEPISIDLSDQLLLGETLSPSGSGGLLIALFAWRKFAIAGPAKFGDVFYRGTAPLLGRPEPCDILVGTHRDLETHLMFDPATGLLIGLEMYPDLGVDPCEVYFSDFRKVNDRMMPHRLEVRHGNRRFGVIQLDQITLAATEGNAA